MYCDVVEMIPRLPDEIIKAGPQGTVALAKLVRALVRDSQMLTAMNFSD